MPTPYRWGAITPIVALGLAGAACGNDARGETSDGPVVVVTTSIWADVTANIACAGSAEVVGVVPAGSDAHAYEPSLQDRQLLESADMIVVNGSDLEEALAGTVDAAARGGTPVFAVTEHIAGISAEHDHDSEHAEHDDEHEDSDHDAHAADEHDDDGRGSGDPHVWFDPTLVAEALPALTDALVADVGLDEATVDACLDDYLAQLDAADHEVTEILDAVPTERRILVTNHAALGHFADHYGFDVLGTVIPSSSTLAETSPSAMQELADRLRATGVPAIFAESQHSTAEADSLAAAAGDVEVVTLHTDSLGPPGSGAETYLGLLTANAHLIADALT